MTRSFVGLGSNRGARRAHLVRALAGLNAIPDTPLLRVSSIFEADAMGDPGQPPFLNAVAESLTGWESGTALGRPLDDVCDLVSGSPEGESVSGDVEVRGGAFERAYFETVNGDVRFKAKLLKGGKLSAESVNGGIDLEFDGEVSASFDIETFNGSIRNCFGPEAQRTSRYTPGLELSFTQGDGDGRVVVETLNGSIDICTK